MVLTLDLSIVLEIRTFDEFIPSWQSSFYADLVLPNEEGVVSFAKQVG